MQAATELRLSNISLVLNDDGGFGGDGTSPPTFSPCKNPTIGVSGGPDSLCLAVLARQLADPLALIVDHGLRPGSADEAAATASLLARLDIPSRVITLTGLAPSAAAARTARYTALIEATRQAGRVELWLGHHRRDQAETVLMRRRAGSGAAGLAAMAAVRETRDVRIVRPLLAYSPEELRAFLRQRGIAWIEDPTNKDPNYLRARLRAELDDPLGDGETVRALAAAAQDLGVARAAREQAMAAELAVRVSIFPEGFALLSPGPLASDALGALIRALSGQDHAPHGQSLARLAADPQPAVLGGVRLMPAGRYGSGLLLVREPAALEPDLTAQPGTLWDCRFLVEALAPPAPGATIGAVGDDAPALRRRTPLPAAVLRALPALRVNGVLVEVPHIGYRTGDGSARMAVSFAPANPASGAPFGACRGRGCQSGNASLSA